MASTWVSLVSLRELLGDDAANALCTVYAGRRIYIPVEPGDELVRILGDCAWTLCAEYRGMEIMLPTATIQQQTKKERIVRLLEQGLSYSEIVSAVGCTERHVAGIASCIRKGLTPVQRLKLKRTKNSGVHRLPLCIMEANGGERGSSV
jgi:uncharacterized protein YerC